MDDPAVWVKNTKYETRKTKGNGGWRQDEGRWMKEAMKTGLGLYRRHTKSLLFLLGECKRVTAVKICCKGSTPALTNSPASADPMVSILRLNRIFTRG